MTRRIVVGVSGASGSIYAQRLLAFLRDHRERLDLDVHVVFSKFGRVVWNEEIGTDPADYGFRMYGANDMTAPFASGSARFDAMVVVPCSAGSVGRVATGVSNDLMGRACDVMLKERRPLVMVLRESPYSLVLLRNLVTVTEAGAIILPASPSFYSHPVTREALVDTVVSRILDRIGLDNELMVRWTGLNAKHSPQGEA
ncbi:MAG: UbiX family flavin prenyltransferase [Rhodobacterales bacterium]|nr:UbiX family flavin prenyltransferase [Rhodobacterales bacterium]